MDKKDKPQIDDNEKIVFRKNNYKKIDKLNNENLDKLNKDTQKTKGDGDMENVIDLKRNEYESCSIEEMILNPEKRVKVREYFDSIYEDTKEEKEIFEAWRKRRIRRNDD